MPQDHDAEALACADLALLDEVERFAIEERDHLARAGIEMRYGRSPSNWDKQSAFVVLEYLPSAGAQLTVWDSGEAELVAAWGQPAGRPDDIMQEHHDFASVREVRDALDRLVALVQVKPLER